MPIPYIIHQLAPANKDVWDPKWHMCQTSWLEAIDNCKKQGVFIQYKLWSDEELDQFVKTKFQVLYDMYRKYPYHIMRIDLARYLILYTMGGIYADMDYEFCNNRGTLKDLFDYFHGMNRGSTFDLCIVGSPWTQNECVQNSFMASSPHHPYWLGVVQEAIAWSSSESILDATGPRLIDRCVSKWNSVNTEEDHVHVLAVNEFNPSDENQDDFQASCVWTRHHRTMVWFKRGGSALG
jgi:mannosyltransferase OCH1-like enzyme